MPRMMINLTEEERKALQRLSQKERRDPRDQAAMLIRERLEEIGWLLNDEVKPTQQVSPDLFEYDTGTDAAQFEREH